MSELKIERTHVVSVGVGGCGEVEWCSDAACTLVHEYSIYELLPHETGYGSLVVSDWVRDCATQAEAEAWIALHQTAVSVTPKELAMLDSIITSEYQDGGPDEGVIDHDVWFDYIVTGKSLGGVFTSLQEKGLVKAYVTKERIDPRNRDLPTLSTIHVTVVGYAIWKQHQEEVK